MANQQVHLYSQERHLEMNVKIALAVASAVIAIAASSLYVGTRCREIQIAHDCEKLGAFEVRGGFYACELKVMDYEESEDFK